jgi:myo-inositol-1(or 4)-monophosphatase
MKPSLEMIESLARRAGVLLKEGFGKEHQVDFKHAKDLVTEMDRKAEDLILGEIREKFPAHSILSEESGSLEGDADHQWIVDPLDGTINYAHNYPVYCVSIAYRELGDLKLGVIYDPMQDELFSAERSRGAALNGNPIRVTGVDKIHLALLGTSFPAADSLLLEKNNRVFVHISGLAQTIRRNGSAALDLAYVAAGRLDGYWQLGNSPWDFAAGALLIQEAGGVVVGLDGNPDFFHPPYSLIGAGATLAGLVSQEIGKAI